jgi:hypothetical protein
MSWKNFKLSPFGRLCVIRNFVIPKITHLLPCITNPPSEKIKYLEKLLLSYLWDWKRHWINKDSVYYPLEMGGLNMLNLTAFMKALKLAWLRRLLIKSTFWTNLFHNNWQRSLSLDIFQIGNAFSLPRYFNDFWQDVINAWKFFTETLTDRTEGSSPSGIIIR